MKEKRVTKRAILASLLSVAVCTSMLIGTSYAWFTDSASSTGNKIKAGTLSIDLQVKKKDANGTEQYVSVKNSQDKIFDYDRWEPGYTNWANVKVTTDGNLALKYTLRFVSDDALDNDAADNLAKAIDVYYASSEINKPLTRQTDTQLATLGLRKLGTLYDVFSGGAQYQIVDTLTPAEATTDQTLVDIEDDATLVFKMQEEAGNIFQGKEIPAFDLQVIAMQNTVEADSFGTDYDAKANGLPDHPEWGNLNTTASAKAKSGEATVVKATGAVLTMPAGAVANDTEVTLSVVPANIPGGITVGDNNTAVTYDIGVTPVDPDVLKKVELNIGSGKTGLVVYHDATAMTKLTAANTTAEGYFYDPSTGILTIWSKTFSPFTIVTAKPASVALSTNKALATEVVAEAISAAKAGDTVTIGSGEAELPATVPENVLVQGKEDGSTKIDTVNVSGNNNGNLKNVAFENITFISPTNTNDSNGYEWDGLISHKTNLEDVTFTNCDFTVDRIKDNACNAIYGGNTKGTTLFENCKISADVYGVNFSHVDGVLIFKNCDITGWNSFGGASSAGGESKVIFENCTFHKSDYGTLRFYQNAEVTNCTFDADFERIDVNADGCTVRLTNCTGIDGKIKNNVENGKEHKGTWFVDGVDISSTV